MTRICLLIPVVFSFSLFSACTNSDSAGDNQEVVENNVFRVMSYNIQHGRGMDGEIDLERIARVITDEGTDIVALQEVDVGVERSGRRDIVRELSELTGMEHVAFGKNLDHQGGDYGNATLSRYPIIEETNTHFEQLSPEPRGILETVIDMGDWTLLVLNTHLAHRSQDEEERLNYVRGTREEILPKYETEAVIFAGDFNDIPGSPTHSGMKEFMTDAWEVSGEGEGLTIPPDNPRRRIDFIFHDDGVVSTAARVPATMASDHLPVVVEFHLQN